MGQRRSCLSEKSQLLVTEVAAMGHHCLWVIIIYNRRCSEFEFPIEFRCVCVGVWLCLHLVGKQVVFVINVCVRLRLGKMVLDKLHFLSSFTDVTLRVRKFMLDIKLLAEPKTKLLSITHWMWDSWHKSFPPGFECWMDWGTQCNEAALLWMLQRNSKLSEIMLEVNTSRGSQFSS